jgi:hypothetical protein
MLLDEASHLIPASAHAEGYGASEGGEPMRATPSQNCAGGGKPYDSVRAR